MNQSYIRPMPQYIIVHLTYFKCIMTSSFMLRFRHGVMVSTTDIQQDLSKIARLRRQMWYHVERGRKRWEGAESLDLYHVLLPSLKYSLYFNTVTGISCIQDVSYFKLEFFFPSLQTYFVECWMVVGTSKLHLLYDHILWYLLFFWLHFQSKQHMPI